MRPVDAPRKTPEGLPSGIHPRHPVVGRWRDSGSELVRADEPARTPGLGQAVPHRSGTQPARVATLGRGCRSGMTRSSSGHPAPDRPVQASDERSYPVRIEPIGSGHPPPPDGVLVGRSASHHCLHLWARWSVVTIGISSRQPSCCRRYRDHKRIAMSPSCATHRASPQNRSIARAKDTAVERHDIRRRIRARCPASLLQRSCNSDGQPPPR